MATREFDDRDKYSARRALVLWLSVSGLAWALWLLAGAVLWGL
jgi:hypothetical protein